MPDLKPKPEHENILWLEQTGEMHWVDGILVVSGLGITLVGLVLFFAKSMPPWIGFGVALMLLGFFSYSKGRQKAYITWTDDHIEKVVISGRGSGWSIKEKDLETVTWDGGQNEFHIIAKTYPKPIKWRDMPLDAQILLGYFLKDTEETEVARPFTQEEADQNSIQQKKTKLIAGWITVIALVATYLLVVINWNLNLQWIGGALGPSIVAGLALATWNYKRAKLAATVPKLADINRDVELEIYEEFGDHADAAARFYRHVWSHNPQKGWLLLPQPTRKRLLNKAKHPPKSFP